MTVLILQSRCHQTLRLFLVWFPHGYAFWKALASSRHSILHSASQIPSLFFPVKTQNSVEMCLSWLLDCFWLSSFFLMKLPGMSPIEGRKKSQGTAKGSHAYPMCSRCWLPHDTSEGATLQPQSHLPAGVPPHPQCHSGK